MLQNREQFVYQNARKESFSEVVAIESKALTLMKRSHNPKVAGSNPAPATIYRFLSRRKPKIASRLTR